MNNGIFVQNLLDKPSSDTGLPRGLSTYNSPPVPYHYPGDDYSKFDKNSIIFIIDTRYESNTSITLQLGGGSYNISINWGDGKTFSYVGSSNITYTYANHGIYTITISGRVTTLGFSTPIVNRNKLIKCLNFSNAITSLLWAFSNSSNLGSINFVEAPEQIPSGCTSLASCFGGCRQFNDSKIKNWNTTNVNNMNGIFNGCTTFNQAIDNWNTSNVTDMGFTFLGTRFNQPIGNWDVSKVTTFAAMFNNSPFNQDISSWNTGSGTTMASMFAQTPFNQNIGNWDVSKVTSFNSFLLSSSNTCPFNQDLSSWNINSSSGVSVNMSSMFRGCFQFNNASSSGINNWNTTRATDTNFMFGACFAFNQPLNDWDVSNVTNMSSMFLSATSFNQPLDSWDVSNVTNMSSMFLSATSFNQPLDSWDVSKVTNFRNMFDNARNFNENLSGWQLVASNIDCTSMFTHFGYGPGGALTTDNGFETWNTSGLRNCLSMFESQVKFDANLGSWDVSNVTNMSRMFALCFIFNNINNSNINNWNTSNVINTSLMFVQAYEFNQPIGNWDVSKVQNMLGMFQNAWAFDQDISNWNLAGLNSNTSLDFFMNNKTGANSYSTANYDALLIGWNNNKLATANGVANWRTDLRPNFGGAKYTAGGDAATARADLVTYGWTITDGGTA